MSIDGQPKSTLNYRSVVSLWALLLFVQPIFYSNTSVHAAEAQTTPSDASVPKGYASRHDFVLLEANRQLQSREFADVERNMKAYIKQIEDQDSRYSVSLANPLLMLGTALEMQEDVIGALEMYGRALHIQRVNQGLHSIDQVPAVYKEANALIAIGNIEKANQKQEYAYEILRRTLGSMNINLLPGLYNLADWYKRTNNIYSARGLYEHARMLIIEDSGELDPRLLRVYSGLADSYKLERFPPYHRSQAKGSSKISSTGQTNPLSFQEQPQVHRYSDGENSLQQIIRIMKEEDEFSSGDTARAVVDLADWNLLFDKPRRAGILYSHAMDLINETPEENVGMEKELFSDPIQLYLPLPADPKIPEDATKQHARTGSVEVAYEIDVKGHTRKVENLYSDPPGIMDIKVRRAVKMARFRPKFEEGIPVHTEGRLLKHEFTYYSSEPRETAAIEPISTTEVDSDREPTPN